jgi:hypothetical protein
VGQGEGTGAGEADPEFELCYLGADDEPVRYELPLPRPVGDRRQLYVHSRATAPRRNRSADDGWPGAGHRCR